MLLLGGVSKTLEIVGSKMLDCRNYVVRSTFGGAFDKPTNVLNIFREHIK